MKNTIYLFLFVWIFSVACNENSNISEKVMGPGQKISTSLDKISLPDRIASSASDEFHLLSPSNNAFVEPNVTLKWEKYTPPSSFSFCFYRVNINGSEITIQNQNTTQYSPPQLQRNQSYSWHVKGHDNEAPSCNSGQSSEESWTFKVRPAKPSVQAAVYGQYPQLGWSAVSGPDHYEIYKDTYSTSQPYATTNSTSYIDWSEPDVYLNGAQIVAIYWVKTVNTSGWKSTQSPGRAFYAQSGPPRLP